MRHRRVNNVFTGVREPRAIYAVRNRANDNRAGGELVAQTCESETVAYDFTRELL